MYREEGGKEWKSEIEIEKERERERERKGVKGTKNIYERKIEKEYKKEKNTNRD